LSTISNIRDSIYTTTLKGNWQSANNVRKKNPRVVIWELPITNQKMNALQVVVVTRQIAFVKKLLNCMDANALGFQNAMDANALGFQKANGDTAFLIDALSRNVKIARKMVDMNIELPRI
jgi:hypothetical protein